MIQKITFHFDGTMTSVFTRAFLDMLHKDVGSDFTAEFYDETQELKGGSCTVRPRSVRHKEGVPSEVAAEIKTKIEALPDFSIMQTTAPRPDDGCAYEIVITEEHHY